MATFGSGGAFPVADTFGLPIWCCSVHLLMLIASIANQDALKSPSRLVSVRFQSNKGCIIQGGGTWTCP